MAKAPRKSRRSNARKTARLVFDRTNYVLLIACVVAIILGYTLMRVENEVDGFLSLYVAPLMILGGYLGVIVAILRRPKAEVEEAV